jgi:hypothetical protein
MTWIPPHMLGGGPAGAPMAMPSDYTPNRHYHDASDVSNLPSTWTPAPHVHPLPDHAHSWDSITNKPPTFAPSAHTHAMPSDYTPAPHTHSFASLTNQPSTYTPSAHTHVAADVVGLQSGGSTGFLTSTTSTLVFRPNGTERLLVMAKGNWSGSNAAQTIALLASGVTKDMVAVRQAVRQAATTDSLPYYLQYSEIPSASTVTIQMRATTGALANTSIIVMRFN